MMSWLMHKLEMCPSQEWKEQCSSELCVTDFLAGHSILLLQRFLSFVLYIWGVPFDLEVYIYDSPLAPVGLSINSCF